MKTHSAVLIDPNSCIKEFADEREPEERRCLICGSSAPTNISTYNMRVLRKGYWYSNALLNPATRFVKRFYLCPAHLPLTHVAWTWARDGKSKDD